MNKYQLESFKTIYFIGIGGIGMSSLARYFKLKNHTVKGYDKTSSPLTEKLQNEGVDIHFEDLGECEKLNQLDKKTTLIIYTPAIPKDMKELNFFQNNGFIILKRAEVLGVITQNSKGLCVAGTHGKTTTSTLLAHILETSTFKCNAFLGGISSNYQTNYISDDKSEYTVIEADEFDRSFLKLHPFASIITTTDPDHLDIYGDEQKFLEGFQEFTNLHQPENIIILKKGLNLVSNAQVFSYALNEDAYYKGENLRVENEQQVIDIRFENTIWKTIKLGLPGIHNAENAIACIALCHQLGLNEEEIRKGIETFKGVKRRFEYHFKNNKIVYIDDYAHHPTEIKALIDSVRLLYPDKKITAIFQPHLFSRTNDFMDDFAKELSKIDNLILLPIYPARELPMEGVTSEVLLNKISSNNKKIVQKNQVKEEIEGIKDGVIITIGAGDIDRIIPEITELLNSKK
jgi:UDP-N-acetylmuramate--alanine ligase